MSVDQSKIFTASSQQWRLIDPNRPTGMPPLTSACLVEKERPKGNVKPPDGSYFYKEIPKHKDSNQNDPRHNSSTNASNKFSVQSRLSKYRKD